MKNGIDMLIDYVSNEKMSEEDIIAFYEATIEDLGQSLEMLKKEVRQAGIQHEKQLMETIQDEVLPNSKVYYAMDGSYRLKFNMNGEDYILGVDEYVGE